MGVIRFQHIKTFTKRYSAANISPSYLIDVCRLGTCTFFIYVVFDLVTISTRRLLYALLPIDSPDWSIISSSGTSTFRLTDALLPIDSPDWSIYLVLGDLNVPIDRRLDEFVPYPRDLGRIDLRSWMFGLGFIDA